MGRFYEDIRVLGGTVSIGSLTSSNTDNLFEVNGDSAVYGSFSTTGLKITNGASSGYILQSDASGNATWVASTSSSANFANTDLTLTNSRQHTIPTNSTLLIAENYFTNGPFLFMGGSFSGDAYTLFGYEQNYMDIDGSAIRFKYNVIDRINIQANETVINEQGGNYDFRIEGDQTDYLFFVDASTDNIGINNNTPNYKLEVSGTVSTTAFRMTNGASNGYILQSDASGNATWVLPTDNTGVTGSGTTNYIPRWTATDTLSSTSSIYDNGSQVTIGTLTASNTGNIFEVSGNVGVYKVSSYINLGLSPTFETQYESTSNTGIEVGSVFATRPNLSGTNTGYQVGGAGILYWDETNNSTNTQGLMCIVGEIVINSSSTNITGAVGVASVLINQTAGGTVSNMYGFRSFWNGFVTHNGWTDNYYGFYMNNPDGDNSNIGNKYGVYINDSAAENIFLGPVGLGGITSPNYELEVSGTVSTTAFRMTNGASSGYILQSDASGNATWVLPTDNAGVTGSGTTNYIPRWTATDTLSSTGSIYDDGNHVGVGTTTLGGGSPKTLEVRGIPYGSAFSGPIRVTTTNGTVLLDSSNLELDPDSPNAGVLGIGGWSSNVKFTINNNLGGLNNKSLYVTNGSTVTNEKYGIQVGVSGNGLSSTNYGERVDVSGANSTNYGYYSEVSGNFGNNKYGFYSNVSGSNGSSTVNYGAWNQANNGVRNVGMYSLAGSGSLGISGDVAIAARVSSVLTSSQSNTYVAYLLNSDDRSGSQAHGVWINNNSNSSTKYGYYATVQGNGTSTTNYGQSITVSGANGNNTGSAIFVGGTYSGVKTGIDLTVNGASPGTNYGIQIRVKDATTENYALRVYEGDVVFNEDGLDYDFRIEGLTQSNLFFVDASNDAVGIATNTPGADFEVNGFSKFGSDAPAIKTELIEVTTPSSGISGQNTAHGITGTIIGYTIVCEAADNKLIKPFDTTTAASDYTAYVTTTSINRSGDWTTNSNVANSPLRFYITYIE